MYTVTIIQFPRNPFVAMHECNKDNVLDYLYNIDALLDSSFAKDESSTWVDYWGRVILVDYTPLA